MTTRYVRRDLFDDIWKRLRPSPWFVQVITGPRQVGKTTLALQLTERWKGPAIYATADRPDTPERAWIAARWEEARRAGGGTASTTVVLLVLDEIQKIPGWSGTIKALWDEDRRKKTHVRAVILGSSALLVQRGLTESLAGRFELYRHSHWTWKECHDAFRLSLEEYFVFGGYPGGLAIRHDRERWRRYLRDAVIETVIGKDVLLMSPVQKPALLRQAWGIAAAHPAEMISYQNFLGQLADAGNATTVAHHLHLLAAAYLLAPLSRWSGSRLRLKASSPKLIIRDNGVANAMVAPPLQAGRLIQPRRGRLVENAVGATLVNLAEREGGEVLYWRDRDAEVDFVVTIGSRVIAIEVKSGESRVQTGGLSAFMRRWPAAVPIVLRGGKIPGDSGTIPLDEFFLNPSLILSR